MAIKLSRLARQDLDEIRRYTIETWSHNQWLKYYRGLVQTFENIMADPECGRDRSLFATGLRSIDYGRHIVFFARVAAAGNAPVILRIIHQRRHLPALYYYDDLA